jgi:hypothetical protein
MMKAIGSIVATPINKPSTASRRNSRRGRP